MNTPPSTPWILRFLICNAGVNGQVYLDQNTLTSWDAFHSCQSFICKTKAEWDRRAKDNVAKDKKRFYMQVELYHPETKERRKINDDTALPFVPPSGGLDSAPAKAGTTQLPEPAQYTLDCIKAGLAAYACLPGTAENLQECLDRIINAVRGTVVAPLLPSEPAKAGTTNELPQTDEGTSQSGNTFVEGVEVPESTLSENKDLETGRLGEEETPESDLQASQGTLPTEPLPHVTVDTPEPPPTTIEGTPEAIAAAIMAYDAAQDTSQEAKWEKAVKANAAKPKPPAKKAAGKKK